MILLVTSIKDEASMNIAKKIIENYSFEKSSESFNQKPIYYNKYQDITIKLVFINEETVNAQFITNHFNPQLVIFLSRHSSVSKIPTLSVHTPGNLSQAEIGGITRRVSISPASAMRDALLEMEKNRQKKGLKYQVSYEGTHHGPSLDVASMFVEVGSSPKQWRDQKAAETVAHAAMAAILKQSKYHTVLGIGGQHYNNKFTRIALQREIAFGHIIPKYAITRLEEEIIRQCIKRTKENVKSIVLDWKGIRGRDKDKLMNILGRIDIPIERV